MQLLTLTVKVLVTGVTVVNKAKLPITEQVTLGYNSWSVFELLCNVKVLSVIEIKVEHVAVYVRAPQYVGMLLA